MTWPFGYKPSLENEGVKDPRIKLPCQSILRRYPIIVAKILTAKGLREVNVLQSNLALNLVHSS